MRIVFFLWSFLLLLSSCTEPSSKNLVTTDVDNFWIAFDKIKSTKDSLLQAKYLNDIFIDKASSGQKDMISLKNYTVDEYLHAINNYPKFWSSIRKNTFKAKKLQVELDSGIDKLKVLYPKLKPAKIYFTIGALKSNGTTLDKSVLIGSELALADKNTITEELPEFFSHLKSYFDSDPGADIVFLNIHEFVHTQQSTTIGETLLAQTVLEGAAEFIAETALDMESPNPQIKFGQENDARIKEAFEKEMFSPNLYNWIWNSPENEFGMRDLAYYVGYRICKNYYENAADKGKAIEEMIDLDYNDEIALMRFVEQSNYFEKPLSPIKTDFENNRPKVVGIGPFNNSDQDVKLTTDRLVIYFDQEMDQTARNFQLGPLGSDHVIQFKELIGFSEDGKSFSFKIGKLEADKRYQIQVGFGFKNKAGYPLHPHLVDIKTEKAY